MRRSIQYLFFLSASVGIWACSASHDANLNGNGSAASDDLAYFPTPEVPRGEEDTLSPVAEGGAPGASTPPPPTNPFVDVAHDPLSTFAADVDTASYDFFRSNLTNYSTLPSPNAIRLEDFVNYFPYSYTPPDFDAAESFSIHLDAAPNLVNRKSRVLRVGIQGKVVSPEDRPPANLVFLIDSSGSMTGVLPIVQQVLEGTLTLLKPSDTIAIVTYAGGAGTILPATNVSEADTIRAAIRRIVAGGGTNGEGGIRVAYAEAEGAFIKEGINHILLCTDGDFNVGVSNIDELEKLVAEKRKSGVTLTAVGFGNGNYNDALMERISNIGNGIYGYVGNRETADQYVQEQMLQTMTHIAKDVKIQIEFNPSFVAAYRLLGYENRAIADDDFRDDLIDAGEMGSGHRVTALYELILQGEDLPKVKGAPALETGADFDGDVEVENDALVRVKVRSKPPGAKESDPATEVFVSLHPEDVLETLGSANSDLQWAIAVASFAELLKGSPYVSDDTLDGISAIVDAQANRDPRRAEFSRLFDQARKLLSTR